MRYLLILVLLLPLVACVSFDQVKEDSISVLDQLEIWLQSPSLVPVGAADSTHLAISRLLEDLQHVYDDMNSSGNPQQLTVAQLIIVWREYFDPKFCDIEDGWLRDTSQEIDVAKWIGAIQRTRQKLKELVE